jgi:hypothetical protein
MGDCFCAKPEEMPTNLEHTNCFNKRIDHHGSYHIGRYKAYQKLILWGSLDPISNEGSSKSQLGASLVAASIKRKLVACLFNVQCGEGFLVLIDN